MNPAQNLHLYFSKGNYAICSLTEYKEKKGKETFMYHKVKRTSVKTPSFFYKYRILISDSTPLFINDATPIYMRWAFTLHQG